MILEKNRARIQIQIYLTPKPVHSTILADGHLF